jgi:ribosomal protein S1
MLTVTDQNKGGLVVRFGRLRGFVPNSHIPELRRGQSRQHAETYKNKKIDSQILLTFIEVNHKKRRLILSARETNQERKIHRLRELEIGQEITGRVVHIVDYGAFVDLGGLDGLIHISELDWRRVRHPSDVLQVGDEVSVFIKDVDVERERVSLSRKELLDNPWVSIEERYAVGDLVEARVTKIVDFGAFVVLPDGIEALIPEDEFGIVGFDDQESVVNIGEKVIARILGIEPERGRMRISLSRVSYDDQTKWLAQKDQAD